MLANDPPRSPAGDPETLLALSCRRYERVRCLETELPEQAGSAARIPSGGGLHVHRQIRGQVLSDSFGALARISKQMVSSTVPHCGT